MERALFDQEHEDFRSMVRGFVATEVALHLAAWEAAGAVDRGLYRKAGAMGLLSTGLAEEHGGGGVSDFPVQRRAQ